jgi:hypothetical protein
MVDDIQECWMVIVKYERKWFPISTIEKEGNQVQLVITDHCSLRNFAEAKILKNIHSILRETINLVELIIEWPSGIRRAQIAREAG